MSRATRRRILGAPVAAAAAAAVSPVTPAPAPLARSGRFDTLVDMGNPMKGINLFPYLRRRVEGRALGALGPAAALELSRTVREAATPRRWPREVFQGCLHVYVLCLMKYEICSFCPLPHHASCKGSGSALPDRRGINPANLMSRVALR